MGELHWRKRVAGPLCAALLVGGASSGEAQEVKQAPSSTVVRAEETGRELQIDIGRSGLVRTPWKVSRVSVADPNIADVQVVGPQQVMIVAKNPGATDVALWGEGEQVMQIPVQVNLDLQRYRQQLSRFLPGSKLEIEQVRDTLLVRGTLPRAEQAAQLKGFLEGSGLKYADATQVAGVQQVMLQVRVAEASRTALRSLGVNAIYGGDDFFGGSTIGGNPSNLSIAPAAGANVQQGLPFVVNQAANVGSAVTLFGGFPGADLEFFIQALAENQYLRVLSEPTLVAVSGEEATFLVGGEFPIPVVQGTTSGAGTSITIEFKEFGVRLLFRPTVMGDGGIRLFVAPEVSDLSDLGAVIIQDFRIPSLLTRRASTTLEMKSGQTFAMAGLIDRKTTARTSNVPGLGEVPVLGSLFRSVRYETGETELVVLVTASLVEPLSTTIADRPVPGVLHRAPNDWELYAEGRIESKTPPKVSPEQAQRMRELGLDRLRGPGAWATYEQMQSPSGTSVESARPAPGVRQDQVPQ